MTDDELLEGNFGDLRDDIEGAKVKMPTEAAFDAARSIGHYCSTRFPCPHAPVCDLLDIPWFAERVQQAIDEAASIHAWGVFGKHCRMTPKSPPGRRQMSDDPKFTREARSKRMDYLKEKPDYSIAGQVAELRQQLADRDARLERLREELKRAPILTPKALNEYKGHFYSESEIDAIEQGESP